MQYEKSKCKCVHRIISEINIRYENENYENDILYGCKNITD